MKKKIKIKCFCDNGKLEYLIGFENSVDTCYRCNGKGYIMGTKEDEEMIDLMKEFMGVCRGISKIVKEGLKDEEKTIS